MCNKFKSFDLISTLRICCIVHWISTLRILLYWPTQHLIRQAIKNRISWGFRVALALPCKTFEIPI